MSTNTPRTDPYTSSLTATPREAALFKSVACGCASVGMLHDDGLKEAVYGMVRVDLIMWERELAAVLADKARLLEAINNALPAPEYLNDHDPIAVSTFKRIYRIIENANAQKALAQPAQ